MAVDVFLKIGDIKGESKDAKHPNEIEVLSWSWGIQQEGTFGRGSGGGAGKADFSLLSVTHPFDKSSPNLMMACARGEHIKEATLTARKAGGDQQEYLIFKLNDVLVTSVQPSGSGEHPVENFTLQPSKVSLEYKPQKEDGKLDAGVFFKYDIVKRTKV